MKLEWTPQFLRKLDLLTVVSRKVFTGRIRGERRSPRRGSGVEFADYRSYVQGDDHRHIDWNAYARFEHFFVKLFHEEEDLSIWFLLDRSRSMAFGGKFEMASRIVAALGYIGLANMDRVGIHAFSGAGARGMPLTHGQGRSHALLGFLEGLEPAGETGLERAVRGFVGRVTRPGLAIVVSDFFDPAGYETALNLLRHHKFEPVAIQVLAREEVDPPVGGDWRLIDSETGEAVEVSLGPRAARLYRQRVEAHSAALERFCRGRNIASLRAVADHDFEDLVLRYFREAALIG